MIRDEFNKVEVTNEKQMGRFEFGKTQKTESTSQKENTLPEGDLNEKYVGKTIKKVTEVNVDYINKVQTHSSSTVVTTSAGTTATSIAAAASSTVAVASTVAVTALAVVTGISVGTHDYQYQFNSLVISANEISYELYVEDRLDEKYQYYLTNYEELEQMDIPIEEDINSDSSDSSKEEKTAPFILKVSNNNYSSFQEIWMFTTNVGCFEHLKLGDTYSITLTENRFGGETIYSDSFTTYASSRINNVNLSETYDLLEGTFDIEMDYEDDSDLLSNFALTLYDPETPDEIVRVFELNKQLGHQSISFMDEEGYPIIELPKTYGYKISYVENGATKSFKEDTINLHDISNRQCKFNQFIFDRKSDFNTGVMEVALDFVDDVSWYSDFVFDLILVTQDGEETYYYDNEFELSKTTEKQTINLIEQELYVEEEWNKFTYKLTANYRGNLVVLDEETEPFSFEDSQGRVSKFNEFKFDKTADFATNSIDVQLDYVDDLKWYNSFTFDLVVITKVDEETREITVPIDLDLTTEVQNIPLDEYQVYAYEELVQYRYYLEADYRGSTIILDEETEPFTFTDSEGRVSKFNSFIFDRKANFITREIEVQLDFVDDLDWYSDFVFDLIRVSQDGDEYYYDDNYISLEKTTEKQTIDLTEFELELDAEWGKYTYKLTANYRGNPITLDEETEPFTFADNSGGVSTFNKFIFDKKANFLNYTFQVQLDYQDDFNYYSDFVLHLFPIGYNAEYVFSLEPTAEAQLLTIDREDAHYGFTFDFEFSYSLTAYYRYGDELTLDSSGEDTFTFEDNSGGISEFDSISFDGTYTMSTGQVPVKLNYQDDFGYYSDFSLELTCVEYPENTYSIGLEPTTDVQYFSVEEYSIATSGVTYTYSLTCYRKGIEQTLIEDAGPITFNDPNATSAINDVIFINNEANFTERSFHVQLDYQDDFDCLDGIMLVIEDATYGASTDIALQKTSDIQRFVVDAQEYDENLGWYYPVDIVDGDLSYNIKFLDYRKDSQEYQLVFEQSKPLSFNNSLNSEFFNFESSWDFETVGTDQYQIPIHFDIENTAENINVLDVFFENENSEVIGRLEFQNEVIDGRWQFANFQTSSYDINDVLNTPIYVRVSGYLTDPTTGDVEEDHVFYRELHTLTLDQGEKDIYGVYLNSNVSGGDMTGYLELVFTGDASMYEEVQLIIETYDKTVLTYDMGVNQYTSVDLLSPNEGSLEETEFENLVADPVKVSVSYRKYEQSDGTGSGSGLVLSDPIVKNCYRSLKIWVSH